MLTGLPAESLREILLRLAGEGAIAAPPASAPAPATSDPTAGATHRQLFETTLHALPVEAAGGAGGHGGGAGAVRVLLRPDAARRPGGARQPARGPAACPPRRRAPRQRGRPGRAGREDRPPPGHRGPTAPAPQPAVLGAARPAAPVPPPAGRGLPDDPEPRAPRAQPHDRDGDCCAAASPRPRPRRASSSSCAPRAARWPRCPACPSTAGRRCCCARAPSRSVMLVENLARWPATPPTVITPPAEAAAWSMRMPQLRTVLKRHPNCPNRRSGRPGSGRPAGLSRIEQIGPGRSDTLLSTGEVFPRSGRSSPPASAPGPRRKRANSWRTHRFRS